MASSGLPDDVKKPSGAGARRPSQQDSTLFSGLMNQKRNSVDATAAARRQSFAEQKPAAGFVGQMWHNFTKGPVDSSK